MVALIACLTHIRWHLLLNRIAATLWSVITTLSLHYTSARHKGALVLHTLHIIDIEAAGLQVYWIGLTLSWLANHVHADMLTLSVNIVLVG